MSLGGLETFYINMEYPEVFGTAGALSPSFWTYDDAAWRSFLGEKDFTDNTPFIYLYTGPAGGDTDPYVTEMYERKGYGLSRRQNGVPLQRVRRPSCQLLARLLF